MKKLFLSTAFIAINLLLALIADAQDSTSIITGTIVDASTKQPLPNATIYLTSIKTSDSKITTAITNGSFVIKSVLPGNYQFKIEYIGYISFLNDSFYVRSDQKNIDLNTINLLSKKGELENVTVKSSSNKPFITQTANAITLNVAQSPIAATSNAYDILLRAPGVMEQDGNLRFRMKTVTILIDGKQTNLSQDDLKNMLSDMPGNSIDKVEIISNPSAKYDAQGGSVINIKLAKNKNYGTTGTLIGGLGEGKYGKKNLGGTANYRNKKLNIYSGYNYDHGIQYVNNSSNRILTPYSNIIQNENDIFTKNNHSYKLGLDYDINRNNVAGILIKGYSTEQKRDFVNNSMLTNNLTKNDTSSAVYTKGNSNIFNPSVNVYYKTILDSLGKELTINIDYFNYAKNWNDNLTSTYFDQNGKAYLPDYLLRDYSPAKNNTTSLAIDYSYPSKIGNFEAGIKSMFTTTDNNILWQGLENNNWITDTTKTNHFVYKENINAAYINYNKLIGQSWEIDAGIRAEQTNTKGTLINSGEVNKKNYVNIFPNINVQYIKNQDNIFSFNYRKSIDRFGFDIVNPFIKYQSQYSYYQGNPNIQPQINHNIEFNYTYKKTLNFGISETHTLNTLGPVYLKSGTTATISSYANFKSSDYFYIYGFYSKEFIKGLTTSFIDGFGFYKFNTSSDSAQQNPGTTWSYLLQLNNQFNIKNGWGGELNATYTGPIASGIYQLNASFNSNLGISKQIFKNKASVKVALTDIFNSQKRVMQINYQGVVMSQIRKAESRVLSLSFTYKFGNKNVKAKKERVSQIDDIKDRTTY